MPLVELQVNKEWCKISDATVRFTVALTYQRSSWDWVAIYKVIIRLFLLKSSRRCNGVKNDVHLLLLHRLDSDITKITRRTYGPRGNMQHRCVRHTFPHI